MSVSVCRVYGLVCACVVSCVWVGVVQVVKSILNPFLYNSIKLQKEFLKVHKKPHTTKEATSRAYRYVYKTIGVEMMRSTAALRLKRLGVALAKPETIKAASKVRATNMSA